MKTWRLMVNSSIEASLLASSVQNHVGSDSIALEQRSEMGIWEWTITSTLETRAMMEEHQDMLRYNKGTGIFWFDGGENCQISRRFFIGYGDGSTRDFLLPFRYLYESSLVFSVNHATVTAWTITGRMVSFGSAPPMDSLIYLEKAKMRFKGFFSVDNDKVYSATDNFKAFDSKEMIIREFPN